MQTGLLALPRKYYFVASAQCFKVKGCFFTKGLKQNTRGVLLPFFHKNQVVITKESEEKVMIARLPNS